MESPPGKRPRPNQRLCPHCSQIVSYKTYRSHKRLYYNYDDDTWFSVSATGGVESEQSDHEQADVLSPASSPTFDEDIFALTEESPPHSDPALSDSDDNASISVSEPDSEVWSDKDELDDDEKSDAESPPSSQSSEMQVDSSTQPLVRWLLAFFLLLQAQFHLTDRVLNIIFRFLKTFFTVLGSVSAPCAAIGSKLPMTFYMAQKSYSKVQKGHGFHKYPVCKVCGTVWKYDDCIEGYGAHKKAKLCSHIPPLSRGRRRQRCNGVLLKTVELATNRKIFYPLMTYCYIDLQTSLEHLLLDADFTLKCSHWKSRISPDSCLEDIYDGRVWKQFLQYDDMPFLAEENSYAFMINIDWFQPYKHLTYSVGAIYLSVFNLPRSQRYKLHNICLIGIMPGPKEPELTVNSYIAPLVQDLLKFWDGVELSVASGSHIEKKLVRCAIICCSCDLPAGRKLCGFLGHSAHLGCSKCKKFFPSMGDGLDHSGFQRANWIPRTNQSHRHDVRKLSQCKSKTELHRKESELGCRYSSLLDLPYFDPPTMLVVDPMHNLFLGVAKHFFKKIFIEAGILSGANLETIQRRIDRMSVPSDIGRIPHKIESSFYHFTADQYKNWVVHYSVICLHGLLSSDHMECWRHFVLACRLLCHPTLKVNDITIADALLLQFCRRTERLFGKEVITPNMHMCCHLRECILDYGPLNHFWLFAFERFNGILGQLPTNNRSIEVQMMKRFLCDTGVMRVPVPGEFKEEFESLISFERSPVGTLGTDANATSNLDPCDVSLPHSFNRSVFDTSEMDELSQLFTSLYPSSSTHQINSTYHKYSFVLLSGKVYGSCKSRSRNSSVVLADLNGEIRPARINFFAKVSAIVDGSQVINIVVCVSWFMSHVQKNICGKPVTVWEHDTFELCSFLPVQCLKCRTVSLVDKLDDTFGTVLFVSPYE